MVFKRDWDSTCPRMWDQWETDGVKWMIQDLPPEDEDEALEIFRVNMIPDALLTSCSGVSEDPVSEHLTLEYWRRCMSQRMSLACYAEADGTRTLVGLNLCIVNCVDDEDEKFEIEAKPLRNVIEALKYIESKLDIFKHLGLDIYLSAMGLVIKREFRGAKLGARILAAREPLCRAFGIKGTSTIFTGEASQKSAAKCGFSTDVVILLKELADIGLNYPRDERTIKIMSKKYD